MSEANAWQALGATMRGEEFVVTTGSRMADTFVFDFLPIAYPFVHKSVLAYPDHGGVATPRAKQLAAS